MDEKCSEHENIGLKSNTIKACAGKVNVIGLGFVNNMAEYMVAADILITKACPGTIVEAASIGLPVLLTSYLPGQEEGNVDFVVEINLEPLFWMWTHLESQKRFVDGQPTNLN